MSDVPIPKKKEYITIGHKVVLLAMSDRLRSLIKADMRLDAFELIDQMEKKIRECLKDE